VGGRRDDWQGKEVLMAKLTTEIGSAGLSEFSGVIQDEFLRELRGVEGYKRYDEMRRNSPIVAAAILAIENLIRQISWNFTSDIENDERVEFLEVAHEGMSHSWSDHIIECLTFLPFGFSYFEIVYKRDEKNRLTWRKFAPRGQDTVYQWTFDEDGGLSGMRQLTRPKYQIVEIPIEKSILYRTRVERGNPEGRSMLRSAWIPYYYAKHIQQIEGIGVERDLAGLPVITLPAGATTDDNDTSDLGKARIIVRNVRNDEQAGIVLPSPEWTFELASTGGSRAFNTDDIIRRYESRMLMAFLAQFIMLGQNSIGTQSLSKDQSDFFSMAVDAVADIISDTFTHVAIPRLLRLNGMDDKGVRLEHTPVGDTNKAMILEMVSKLGERVTWDAEEEVWLRGVLGLPEREVEEVRQAREKLKQEALAQEQAKQAWRKDDDKPFAKNTIDAFFADAPDKDKREQSEREWEEALLTFFERQKGRVVAGVSKK
jgi:hypothetical protein